MDASYSVVVATPAFFLAGMCRLCFFCILLPARWYSLPLFPNQKLPIELSDGGDYLDLLPLYFFASRLNLIDNNVCFSNFRGDHDIYSRRCPPRLSHHVEILPHERSTEHDMHSLVWSFACTVRLMFTTRATFSLRCSSMLARSGMKYEASNPGN